ncbi:hypothetical protein BH09ACT8_BH09ACT8_40270 [soil metagenome]
MSIAAIITGIDAAGDETLLRSEIDRAHEAVRAELAAHTPALTLAAAAAHALLERCGIRGDANGVLASRPRFCRRRASWAEGIERWSGDPKEDRGVVMTGLLADSTGLLARSDGGKEALRPPTAAAVLRSYPVRQAMLQDATTVRAHFPSRLRVFASHTDSVDLKLAAIDPVVKIARWAALSAGSDTLSTLASTSTFR